MTLPKILGVAALSAALLTPAAQAAPWSAPATVPGSSGQSGGAPNVLETNTRGNAIAFNAPGSFPGTALLSSANGAPATAWPGAVDFDATFGSFSAADRIIYAGSDGHRRVNVAIAPGPGSAWRVQKRGPQTGGARVATAAAPKHTVAAFSTFGRGDIGSVYVVRQSGTGAPGATERISGRGHIRSVAVAVNASGDVLAAWDRSGTVESRMYSGRSHRWAPVKPLGEVTAAMHMTAAIGADRRALVGWVDQPINEGGTNKAATFFVSARTATRGFTAAKQVDVYPDLTIVGGSAIRAAYTSDGRGLVAWTGRTAVRAALVSGRSIGAPQDLGPAGADESQNARGLYALAVSPDGQAVVTMVAGLDGTNNQIMAAPLAADAAAFGPAEAVSAPAPLLQAPSAAFDPRTGNAVTAWSAGGSVEVSQRPAP
jgi:hypothetical protein